jgi:hypothetical protein
MGLNMWQMYEAQFRKENLFLVNKHDFGNST